MFVVILLLVFGLNAYAQVVKQQDSQATATWTYDQKQEINTAGFVLQQSTSQAGPWTDILNVTGPTARQGVFTIHFPTGITRLYFIVHAYATPTYRDQQLKAVPPITQEYISSTPPVPVDMLVIPGAPPTPTDFSAK